MRSGRLINGKKQVCVYMKVYFMIKVTFQISRVQQMVLVQTANHLVVNIYPFIHRIFVNA